jgi:hypothetical protein
MKLHLVQANPLRERSTDRGGERGFLVFALMVMLSLMLLYVMASVRLLGTLKQDVKAVEKKQIQRLERAGADPVRQQGASTNAVPPQAAVPPVTPVANQ